MTWISPKTITGPPAEGEKYLIREDIEALFWIAISKGEHVRFTAPRRVGKSSVMKNLEKKYPANTLVIYQNIESDKTSQEFYKRLWTLLVNKMNTTGALKAKFLKWFGSRRLGGISPEGNIEIEKVDIDYKTELLELITELGNEKFKLVMLLDEFPDMILSISKNESPAVATDVLHTLRAIRHDEKFKNFTLVLAGSVGLEHVIASIDRIKLINDLKAIPIPALSEPEAQKLLDIQLDGASMKVEKEERRYLLAIVKHLMPYYLQLMIEQCNEIVYEQENPAVTNEIIDRAFKMVVGKNENFADWEKRLKDYLHKEDYDYCIGLLSRCAHRNYTIQEAYGYSKKTNPTTGYKSLIDDVLIKDGYIVNDNNALKFLSPFLQAWWQNRHPEFEIED